MIDWLFASVLESILIGVQRWSVTIGSTDLVRIRT
jgi:hypothetical protein